jgi:hypothetical protein
LRRPIVHDKPNEIEIEIEIEIGIGIGIGIGIDPSWPCPETLVIFRPWKR